MAPADAPEPGGTRLVGGRNLLTPHPPESYPGLTVVRPGPAWAVSVIVPEAGQTLLAHGGERLYAYRTPDGARAEALELGPGDRARLMPGNPGHGMAEWRIWRSGERCADRSDG